jgi:Polysaccharide biosynthesis protein
VAAVQRASISQAQHSTLFWINLGIGLLLATLCVVAAPFLVTFYQEPRLLWIAVVVGLGFLFNGAAAQAKRTFIADASGPRSLAYRQTAEANRHAPFQVEPPKPNAPEWPHPRFD